MNANTKWKVMLATAVLGGTLGASGCIVHHDRPGYRSGHGHQSGDYHDSYGRDSHRDRHHDGDRHDGDRRWYRPWSRY